MRRSLLVVLGIALLAVPTAFAAGRGEPGPVHEARIQIHDRLEDLALLHALDIDVDAVFHGQARIYVIDEEVEKLRSLGFTLELMPPLQIPADAPGESLTDSVPAAYHTYATLTADLQQIAADHPQIARLVSVGQSEQGLELWAMELGDNPDVDEDEPEFLYISSMHGDEVVGKELCFNLIDYLTDHYGSDPRVTQLLDTTEIWILPSMNPDGTELGRRYNANWIDLNRDFPDQFDDPVNTPAGRAAETAAVMSWRDGKRFSLSANFHGGALVANYPFDSNTDGLSVYSPSPDDAVFVSIARTYADANPPMSTSNGSSAFNNGITNGADWYAINGGMQDWHYVWYGGMDVTLEVSNVKWPPASELPQFWDDNLESMLQYAERVHEGVRGIVTDATSGNPLPATIRIAGNPFATQTDAAVGNFHRLLLPGRYTMEIEAVGYSKRLVEIDVADGPASRYDVSLTPLDAYLAIQGACADEGVSCPGRLAAGQSNDLKGTLHNLGVAVTGVSAEVVPTGWYADVVRAGADYPDLVADEAGSSASPHHALFIDGSVPAGHKVGFAMRWQADQGTGLSDPFFLGVGDPACSVDAASDTPLPIADRQTTSSQVAVDEERELTSVEVTVDVSHTYRGDLQLTLVAPSGLRVLLHDRDGGSADDIVGTYGVDLISFEPLSKLAGASTLGSWSLEVNDGVPGNGGTVNSWSIETCGRPFEAMPPEMRLKQVGKSGTIARLEWWAYPGVDSYRVYRSTDPASAAGFVDVSGEDADPTDTLFEDGSTESVSYFLVTAVGRGGEGPKGHYGE